MVKTILIARHGFRTSWGNNGRFPMGMSAPPTSTPRDVALTQYGVQQAQELAEHLQHYSPKVEKIYSSPYYRCLQTATPFADLIDLPLLVEPGFAEFYMTAAPNTGLHPFPQDPPELVQYFPRIMPDGHKPLVYPSRKGESIEELHQRTARTLKALIESLEADKNGPDTILIVSHAASIITMGRALLGTRDKEINVGCCSLSRYTRGESSALGSWTMEENGDSSFLKNGEERNWSFDLIEEGAHEPGLGEEGPTSTASKL